MMPAYPGNMSHQAFEQAVVKEVGLAAMANLYRYGCSGGQGVLEMSMSAVCVDAQIKEVALIHSEGVLAGEMKHGTLALVDSTLPIIVIATHGSCYRKMVGVIEQLRARDAQLVVLANEGDDLLTSPAAEGCIVIEVWLPFDQCMRCL
jgi:fructoselysine-6-P-deglycase FrlB-like protein